MYLLLEHTTEPLNSEIKAEIDLVSEVLSSKVLEKSSLGSFREDVLRIPLLKLLEQVISLLNDQNLSVE